jgi:hypothetical protein
MHTYKHTYTYCSSALCIACHMCAKCDGRAGWAYLVTLETLGDVTAVAAYYGAAPLLRFCYHMAALNLPAVLEQRSDLPRPSDVPTHVAFSVSVPRACVPLRL